MGPALGFQEAEIRRFNSSSRCLCASVPLCLVCSPRSRMFAAFCGFLASSEAEGKRVVRMKGFRLRAAAAAAALIVLGLSFGGAAQQGSGGFVGGVEDLPLMPGLVEVAEARMVFDKPGGRIVEAFAVGRASAAAVREFYDQALPQLGWRRLSGGGYGREDEILTLDIGAEGDEVTVRFSISPR